jgi:hypothetical protein
MAVDEAALRSLPAALVTLIGEERVLWIGRPNRLGICIGQYALAPFIAAAAGLGLAVMMVQWGLTDREVAWFGLSAFLLFGCLWLLGDALKRRYRAAGRTWYVLTESRMMVISPLLRFGAFVLRAPQSPRWRRTQSRRGLYHMTIDVDDSSAYRSFASFCCILPLVSPSPGFYFLDDADELDAIVRADFSPPDLLQ